jgi:ribosomal-protein-alanine N-acetyltransferase
MMIELTTDRLIIRDNMDSDLQGLYELTSNPFEMRYMRSTKIESYEEAVKNLNESIEESKKQNRTKYYFAIVDKKNNTYIGAIGYVVEATTPRGKLVDLGYFIKREYWNKGIVTEAGRKVVEYAFIRDDVYKIEAGCLKENPASEKVMKKLGMKKEGELRTHQYHENEWKDRILYGLIKEEWEKDRPKEKER